MGRAQERPRAVVAWSSGKDSAMAAAAIRAAGTYEITGLLSTVSAAFDRVSMHGVRRALLEAQARALGLPLTVVEIPYPCPNDTYEAAMGRAVSELTARGVEAVVFGDIFLEDVRAYRERHLAGTGLAPVFPLWGRNTGELAREALASGVRAVVTTVDPRVVPTELAGRPYDAAFLADLPPGADPCGENGEFHTFVWDAPLFSEPIPLVPGPVVERDGFVFADFRPAG